MPHCWLHVIHHFCGRFLGVSVGSDRLNAARQVAVMSSLAELFDREWYVSAYPDVAKSGLDPQEHYLFFGAAEGRSPAPWFSPDEYAKDFPAETWPGGNPLLDYARRISRDFQQQQKERVRRESNERLHSFLNSDDRVLWEDSGSRITAVVPVWNHANLTLDCLRALAASSVSVRVVVIDNGSTDETRQLLDRFAGIQVIRNESNLGFVDATNQGIAVAETEFVLLLNNDAMVSSDSLWWAIAALDSDSSVAGVASKVVLPNGLIQDAGNFLWPGGQAEGYLRGSPPSFGAAMYQRDVDFGAGAALLLRTELVKSLGALAEEFRPAYGEEVDLCLRIWKQGSRIIYEPAFEIQHLEYGSAEKSDSAIKLMQDHREILLDRHAEWLVDRSPASPLARQEVALTPERHRRRFLVVDDRIPFVSSGSGDPRAADLLWSLQRSGVAVTLVSTQAQDFLSEEIWRTLPRDLEVRPGLGVEGLPWLLDEMPGRFEAIVACRPNNLEHLLAMRERYPHIAQYPLVYDAEAVVSAREVLQGELSGDTELTRKAAVRLSHELATAREADVVVAVSQPEAKIFSDAGCQKVTVLGHRMPVESAARKAPTNADLLFVGRLTELGSPNVDSMLWFIQSIFPKVLAEMPTARLRIAGMVSDSVRALLEGPNIEVLGKVEDLKPLFLSSRVFVAPTRFAAGIPMKITEASARGLPVVSTRLLADQLGWDDGAELLVGEDENGFAAAVVALLKDDALWSRIRSAALVRAGSDFDPEVFDRSVGQIVDLVVESHYEIVSNPALSHPSDRAPLSLPPALPSDFNVKLSDLALVTTKTPGRRSRWWFRWYRLQKRFSVERMKYRLGKAKTIYQHTGWKGLVEAVRQRGK
jgi:GT2 family glycosyltransferase/glycosyltransferase involved in cell wall biosynthesis